jgi:hypothetical protein
MFTLPGGEISGTIMPESILLSRSFSGLLRKRSDYFLKFPATEPAFFRNSQETIRSFFEIPGN